MTLSRFFEKVEAEAAGKEMKRHNADDPTVREVSPCRVSDDEDLGPKVFDYEMQDGV